MTELPTELPTQSYQHRVTITELPTVTITELPTELPTQSYHHRVTNSYHHRVNDRVTNTELPTAGLGVSTILIEVNSNAKRLS